MAAATWLPAQGDPGPGRRLGDVLRSYRKANGLFQQDVADMLGYDRTYISARLSSGWPTSPVAAAGPPTRLVSCGR